LCRGSALIHRLSLVSSTGLRPESGLPFQELPDSGRLFRVRRAAALAADWAAVTFLSAWAALARLARESAICARTAGSARGLGWPPGDCVPLPCCPAAWAR